MLTATSMNELYYLMDNSEPGQLIKIPKGLLREMIQKHTFAQNFKQSDPKVTYCNNRYEAQALANFLWNERERHKKDVEAITEDLDLLLTKWNVQPDHVSRFVKP